MVTTPSLDFRYKTSDCYDLGRQIEDIYKSPLSTDTKKILVAPRLTSQWRLNDVIVTKKKRILQIFTENILISNFHQKSWNTAILMGIFANHEMK